MSLSCSGLKQKTAIYLTKQLPKNGRILPTLLREVHRLWERTVRMPQYQAYLQPSSQGLPSSQPLTLGTSLASMLILPMANNQPRDKRLIKV